MKSLEFVLWLNGISELLGDQPPSAEQWATIRAGLSRSVGEVVKSRILELATTSEQVKYEPRTAYEQQLERYRREVETAKAQFAPRGVTTTGTF